MNGMPTAVLIQNKTRKLQQKNGNKENQDLTRT